MAMLPRGSGGITKEEIAQGMKTGIDSSLQKSQDLQLNALNRLVDLMSRMVEIQEGILDEAARQRLKCIKIGDCDPKHDPEVIQLDRNLPHNLGNIPRIILDGGFRSTVSQGPRTYLGRRTEVLELLLELQANRGPGLSGIIN